MRSVSRPADRVAALLEDPDRPTGDHISAEEQALADLAHRLQAVQVPAPPMRIEAKAALRTAVVEAARTHQPEPPLLTRLRDGARRLRYSTAAATGAGATAMALSGGGVALAAEHAAPDDAVYDVKLVLEDLRLGLTFDDVARGERAMAYAFDRLAEAEEAVDRGADDAAAEALRGAADRTRRGSELLLAADLVDPVRGLAEDLSTQVAVLESLQPRLGPSGQAAAEELLAVIVVATEGVLELIEAEDWPSGVPSLPGLPVPEQTTEPTATSTPTPTPTATPTPTVTTPEVEAPAAAGTATPTPLPGPVPDPGGVVEDTTGAVGDAIDGVGDAVEDTTGAVDDAVDGVGGAVGGAVEDTTGAVDDALGGDTGLDDVGEGLGNTVEGVTGGLGDVIEETGETVDDVGDGLEETLDGVVDALSPLQQALPEPLEGTVEALPGTVDGVVDVVPGVLQPVPEVLDGVGGLVGGLLRGLL